MEMLSPKRFFENRLTSSHPHPRPKDNTKKIRKGIVVEVTEHYGRILCARSFSDMGAFVFFNHNTTVNGTPLNLGNFNLQAAVPVGAEVDFKMTFGFPSRWRTYSSYMGYFCESINFDVTQEVPMFHAELLVKENRHDIVIAADSYGNKAVIHPHIWPSANTIRKLFLGNELEAKANHRYQVLTQPGRTLLALVLPVPSFLKSKLRRLDYLALSAHPLSTTVVCYASLVGVGPNDLMFDSIGVREDTGDNIPVEIVMSRDLFLESLGYEKGKGNSSKIDLCDFMNERYYQLGCVQNIPNQKATCRAFCAYRVPAGYLPKNPKMQMPRVYSKNSRHNSAQFKNFPSVEKKDSVFNVSFTRRSFQYKYAVRRSIRAHSRKRAFTPCSPYTDLAAKRKNINDSFRDVTLSDY